jgi:outer membrane protein assembly factor BamB
LLTLAQDTVYVNTNLGAVVALSARDGTVQWVTRYSRAAWSAKDLRARPWYLLRDLTPCLWHEGHLVVAPMDYDGLFALDGTSGRLLWNTELPPGQLDITHLLGVVNGQLIASGRRLWWFDMATGEPSTVPPENPFPRELSSSRFGFGRGLLAGEQVFWPTRGGADQILVFDVASGRVARQPLSLTAVDVSAGNLVAGPRHLLVAGPEQLAAFRIVSRISGGDDGTGETVTSAATGR